MSINKQFVHFNLREDFDKELAAGNILDTSIVFIKDTLELYTHGLLYQGSKPDWNSEETSPGFIQNKPLVDYTTPEIYMDVSVLKHKGDPVGCEGTISSFPIEGHTYRVTINGETEIRKATKYTVPEGQSSLVSGGYYFPRISPDKVNWSLVGDPPITDVGYQNAFLTFMLGGLTITPATESEGYLWTYNPEITNINTGESTKLTEDTLYTIKMEDLDSVTSVKKFDSKYCYNPDWGEILSTEPTYIQNKPFGNLYDYEIVVDGQMYLMDAVYETETTMVIAWISYPKAPLLSDIFYKVTVDGNLGGQCLSHEYSYTVEGVTYKGVAIAETYKLIDNDSPSGHYPDSNWGFATLEIEGMLVGVWLQRYKKPAEETASILSLDESSTEEPALEDLFIKALGDNPSQLVSKLYNTNSDSVSNSDEGIALLSDSPLPGEGYDIPTTEEEMANFEVRTIKVESLEKVNSIKKLDEKWLDTTWKKGSGSESVKTNSNLAVGESTVAHGSETYASGPNSHSEGFKSSAWGFASHAEGWGTTANANASHAEGHNTNTTGSYSHAEGEFTEASGYTSHAEGYYSKAKGEYTHAEGAGTVPWGKFSHAEGSDTYTNNYAEHASGMYNTSSGNQGKIDVFDGSADATLASVGNGTSETRHNAVEVRQSGEMFIQETADRNAELTKPLVSVQNKILMLNNILNDLYEHNTNGHECVDLGLPSGNLWATCNLGATTPTEVGKFFQWGDTLGYTKDEIGTEEGKKPFNYSDYKFSGKDASSSNVRATKYCCSTSYSYNSSFVDYLSKLELIDDAALAILGGDWRMPSEADFQELIANTTGVKNSNYNNTGISVCVLTSKINGATLVLPLSSSDAPSRCNNERYWTSELDLNAKSYNSYAKNFLIYGSDNGLYLGLSLDRYYGFQVRPIISGHISGGGNKKYYSKEYLDSLLDNLKDAVFSYRSSSNSIFIPEHKLIDPFPTNEELNSTESDPLSLLIQEDANSLIMLITIGVEESDEVLKALLKLLGFDINDLNEEQSFNYDLKIPIYVKQGNKYIKPSSTEEFPEYRGCIILYSVNTQDDTGSISLEPLSTETLLLGIPYKYSLNTETNTVTYSITLISTGTDNYFTFAIPLTPVTKLELLDVKTELSEVDTTIQSKLNSIEYNVNSFSSNFGTLNTKVTNLQSTVDSLNKVPDEPYNESVLIAKDGKMSWSTLDSFFDRTPTKLHWTNSTLVSRSNGSLDSNDYSMNIKYFIVKFSASGPEVLYEVKFARSRAYKADEYIKETDLIFPIEGSLAEDGKSFRINAESKIFQALSESLLVGRHLIYGQYSEIANDKIKWSTNSNTEWDGIITSVDEVEINGETLYEIHYDKSLGTLLSAFAISASLDGIDGELFTYYPKLYYKSIDNSGDKSVLLSSVELKGYTEFPSMFISTLKVTQKHEETSGLGYIDTLPVGSLVSVASSHPALRGGLNRSNLDLYYDGISNTEDTTIPTTLRSDLGKPITNLSLGVAREGARKGFKELLSYNQYKVLFWLTTLNNDVGSNISKFLIRKSYYNMRNWVGDISTSTWSALNGKTAIVPNTPFKYHYIDSREFVNGSISYLIGPIVGLLNYFGDTFTAVDGIYLLSSGNGTLTACIYDDPEDYSDGTIDFTKVRLIEGIPTSSGYINEFVLGTLADILPGYLGASSNTGKCAYYVAPTGNYKKLIPVFGSQADSGNWSSPAMMATITMNGSTANTNPQTGFRTCYVIKNEPVKGMIYD